MDLIYYPGCTVKSTAKDYEKVALAVLEKLGFKIHEIDNWTCCGVVPGLAEDSAIYTIAPYRNLIRAQEFAKRINGSNVVFSLCSMCYHTLKQANIKFRNKSDIVKTLAEFIEDEAEYEGNLEIRHVLEILYRYVGPEKIRGFVKKDLNGVKVATFYGCLLLRPQETAIDDPEDPTILEDLLIAIGAEPVDYPYRIECCGSYNVVRTPEVVEKVSSQIVMSAYRHGAKAIITTCPLCLFNLERSHEALVSSARLPVLYLSELMAYAFGMEDILPEDTKAKINKIMKEV